MKLSAHSKAVLDDSWITVHTTSPHQQKLYFIARSLLSHSESEQYRLRDLKYRSMPVTPAKRSGIFPHV